MAKAKPPKEKVTLSLDKELKRRFDTVCRWREVTMSEVAEKLFESWLEENAPPGLLDSEENKT